MNKNWFVILNQNEFEKCINPAQITVFASIKSYSRNGREKTSLSYRDIARRGLITHEYARKVVTQLIVSGLIKIVGTQTRRGGKVNIYEVSSTQPVYKESGNTVATKNTEVSTEEVSSVNPSRSETLQSKKIKRVTEDFSSKVKESEIFDPFEFAVKVSEQDFLKR